MVEQEEGEQSREQAVGGYIKATYSGPLIHYLSNRSWLNPGLLNVGESLVAGMLKMVETCQIYLMEKLKRPNLFLRKTP